MLNDTLMKLYLAEQYTIAYRFPYEDMAKLIEAVMKTYQKGRRVFTFGNGGGASIADHFAADVGIHPFVSEDKRTSIDEPRLEIHCLNSSDGLLTCLANDMGYDWIFVEQLRLCRLINEDLVIAFSTSGNSPNIVYALGHARGCGATTALVGGRDGGKAKKFADICILIPGHSEFPGQKGANDNCFHIEDFQQSIAHMITGILKERISQ